MAFIKGQHFLMFDAKGVLYCDNSILSAVAECSTLAKMRYWHGYTTREDNARLLAGKAAHAALADWLRGASDDDCLKVFAEHYEEYARANVPNDDRLSWDNTLAILRRWLETHPLHRAPFAAVADTIEKPLFAWLDEGDGIVFFAMLDSLVSYRDAASYYVREVKTTGRIAGYWREKWRLASQISGQCWVAEQNLGVPVAGALVDAIEFSRLPSDEKRKCKEHAVVYAECAPLHARFELIEVGRTREALDTWRLDALHLARKYRDLVTRFPDVEQVHRVRMQGTYNGHCGFCELADWCWSGRRLDLVSGMLQHSPWRPFPLQEA